MCFQAKFKIKTGLSWWLGAKDPLASAGDMGSISDLGRSHMLQRNWTCAPQLLGLYSRALELKLLRPHTLLEPIPYSKRSHSNKKPMYN